jgi:hypothetical protein
MGTDWTDLQWLAFCYIADELSADEAEVFEERLAADQEAREAVARAVELSQAVAALPRETVCPSPAASPWRRRLAWMTVGATAACLAFAVWLLNSHLTGPGPAPHDVPLANGPGVEELPVSVVEDPAAGRLLALWSHSADVVNSVLALRPSEPAETNAEFEPIEVAEVDNLAVPGWMLAAVSTEPVADPKIPGSAPEDN